MVACSSICHLLLDCCGSLWVKHAYFPLTQLFFPVFQGKVVFSRGDIGLNHQIWPSDLKSCMDVSLCQTSPLLAPPPLCQATLLQRLNLPAPPSGICCNAAPLSSQTQLNSPQVFYPSLQPPVQLRLTLPLETELLNIWWREESSPVAVKTAPSRCTLTAPSVTCCCIFPPALPPLPPRLLPLRWLHPHLNHSTRKQKPPLVRDDFLTQTYPTWMNTTENKRQQPQTEHGNDSNWHLELTQMIAETQERIRIKWPVHVDMCSGKMEAVLAARHCRCVLYYSKITGHDVAKHLFLSL